MQFQILNNGHPLTMDELDKEAAAFFGVEFNDKTYAKPSEDSLDWFNIVGFAISVQREGKTEWSKVIAAVLKPAPIFTKSYDGLQQAIELYRPHIELCYHWQSKGYIPVSC